MALILAVTPEEDVSSGLSSVSVTLTVTASESADTHKFIEVDYDWGDGSDVVHTDNFDNSDPIEISATHAYGIGEFTLRVSANNRNYPTESIEIITRQIAVSGPDVEEPVFALTGPILPRDTGHPNKDEWLLDTALDDAVLESSLKSLFLTQRGERLHQPTFGTNLRRLVFSAPTSDIRSLAMDDVTTAIATWEPRVRLIDLRADQVGTSIELTVTVASALSSTPLDIVIPFNPL